MANELNLQQKDALLLLRETDSNIFLTGAAGSGKSFLLRAFTREVGDERLPLLASTGAAAILVGGRTFHSFFGLGILEGGVEATVERAIKNKRLTKRLQKTEGVIIDEVSMLSGAQLRAAEMIARKARGNSTPWGGMRIITVGDFAQLPPVNPFSQKKEWAFLDPVWDESEFEPILLTEIMRTTDSEFLKILNSVRNGQVDLRVKNFLDERAHRKPLSSLEGECTRLFSRKDDVERHNLERLSQIGEPTRSFVTLYIGKEKEVESFKKNSPLPDVIQVKKGALVMLRQNDPERRWVNGSLGHVRSITDEELGITLLSGKEITVEKAKFTLLNADGDPVVTASNFPITLAWAMTIHKAQGTTLDRMQVDLRRLWEPGQAYVALSRARDADGLFIEGWHPQSIISDPEVKRFHDGLVTQI